MITSILHFYFSLLFGSYIATVVLILFGSSWGRLPHFYLKIVSRIQQLFPSPQYYEQKKGKNYNTDSASEVIVKHSFDLTTSAIGNGLDSLVHGDLATCFSTAPTPNETLLRFKPVDQWGNTQKLIFYICLFIRLFFLFPIRMFLFISSFIFVAGACVVAYFKDLTNIQKTWVAIIYCRLFCSGTGLIAFYNNLDNRPQKPGIAVSNHLSPNDIQILFAGTPHKSSFGYIVTGQKHTGIIGVIEKLVERLCPSIWLERKCSNERLSFLNDVLNIAKKDGPVLLFPEGYCSNNTQVLQFRKAVFEENVNIYPISIKQDANYGDGFWFEDQFHIYLFRVMTSWALVYDIKYLDVQTRYSDEDNITFAKRIQNIIAEEAGIPCCEYGGDVWYKKGVREKMKEATQLENLCRLKKIEENRYMNIERKTLFKNVDSVDSRFEKLITVYG